MLTTSAGRRVLVATLALLVLMLGAPPFRSGAATAYSGPLMTLDKSVEGAPDPLVPGSAFSYKLTLSCSSLSNSCVNAYIEDTLPAEFDATTLPQSTPTMRVNYDPATRKLRIDFVNALASPPNPAGSVGLPAGTTADVSIGMRVPATGPLKDGQSVTNTATAGADNAAKVIGTTTQTVTIPKNLDAKATKSWQPGADVAQSGGVSTIELGAANTSSSTDGVSLLRIEDASPELYENFDLVSLGPVTAMPKGADRVTVLVCTKPPGSACGDSEWVRSPAVPGPALSLPAGVSAAQVTGVRFEFTDSTGRALPYDAGGAKVPMQVKLRDTRRTGGAKIDPAGRTTVTNCAEPSVKDAASRFTIIGVPGCATHDILPNIATVDLEKRFFPDNRGDFTQNGTAVRGEHSGATAQLTAGNSAPFAVATLTITEPSGSAVSEFDKVDADKLKLDFPDGATSAVLTVTCRDGSTAPAVTLANPPKSHTLASTGCPAGSPPRRISVTYSGERNGAGTISPGASAGLAVHGTLNDKVTAQDSKDGVSDCADAAATNPANGSGSAAVTACASLKVEDPDPNGYGFKSSSWTEIPPDQDLTYSLGYTNQGNVTLPNLQLTDPPDPAAAGNPFDQLEIVAVSTDANPRTLKLAVQLYDPALSSWVDYVPPDTALLARAKGVRLKAPDGVPVGGFMRATVTVRLRPGVTSGKLRNCVGISIGGAASGSPSCSEEVDVKPAKAAASLQKTLDPGTVLRPVTGIVPQDVAVRLTTLNSGNIGLRRLIVTDTDPAFFDAVTVTRLAGVTFPAGADRVRVDVCTTGCTASPPVFVTGTPTDSTTPGFPAGVAPADIQGLRVTFSSSAGGYPILPATAAPGGGNCPNSSVCLVVQPRTGLRSDAAKPIPDALPDTASGAGESRLQPDGGTFPIPDSTATLTVREGSNRLRVEKEPEHTVLSPGAAAPFNLHVRNTGTAPVPDLVIVDDVPGGLRFDDAFQGDQGLPYTLRYTLPPGAKEPARVLFEPVRDAGGRITKLVWRFPGWTFYPSEEVVVGYQVKLAGGVAAGTAITNVFGAGSATAPQLNCDPQSPRLGQVTDDPRYGPGTFCTSDADVVSRSGVSFDAAKWVTGDRALGYQDANTGAAVPAGDPRCPELTVAGVVYTRYPCVALTRPGQRFGFVIRVENTGTEPAKSLHLLDVFPAPGDTGVLLGDEQRGTQWDSIPTLTGPVGYTGTGNAAITYTTTRNPCGSQVATPRRSCAAASWNADTARATAFQAAVDFPAGMAPGTAAVFALPFQAPADLSTPGYPSVAWNSFAHTETVTVGGSTTDLPVTEPPKAGIGLVFGNVRILKNVVDPPAGVAVGPFTLAYSCLLTTASGDAVEVRGGQVRFDPGKPFDLSGVPAGAVCRFWETDSAGAQSDHQGEANAVVVTVTPAADATTRQQAEISNHYPRRDLVIAKRVTGQGAALVGEGPFKVTVDCAFNGKRLPGFPQELVFRGDGSQSVTDLPQGSSCDVLETDNGGASHVEYDLTHSSRVQLPPRPGEIEEPGPAGGPATVIITNDFPVGALSVTKKLTGAGAPQAGGPFRFRVSCDFNGRSAVLTRDVELTAPDHLTGRLDGLPVGALCTVTETDSGGADAPAKPVHGIVIKEGTTDLATAELSNTFSAGRLTLAKILTGPLAEAGYLKDAAFGLHVICRRDGHDVLDRTVTVRPGAPVSLPELLLVGTRCWATELPSGAGGTVVDHPDELHAAEVGVAAPDITITASNEYRPATLSLLKRTTGPGADAVAAKDVAVELSCRLTTAPGAAPIVLVDRRRYLLRPGQLRLVDDLPAPLPGGAHCWLTEPDPAGADSTVIDHGDEAHALLLDGTTPGVITATNHYPDSGRPLPDTGSDLAPWALGAFGLLLLGTLVRLRARRTD
ncbi:DUF5979 domain-containing protein [Kitasatospora mediocidica]|uniref:DUF5979 domain-containing protein n=1 Tax=Kitasatospora mediocidica TaxID=58352 RepID=UPI00055E56FA|nr:DUF5979 domain-containing protein [Kitasatospora mediocidica]